MFHSASSVTCCNLHLKVLWNTNTSSEESVDSGIYIMMSHLLKQVEDSTLQEYTISFSTSSVSATIQKYLAACLRNT